MALKRYNELITIERDEYKAKSEESDIAKETRDLVAKAKAAREQYVFTRFGSSFGALVVSLAITLFVSICLIILHIFYFLGYAVWAALFIFCRCFDQIQRLIAKLRGRIVMAIVAGIPAALDHPAPMPAVHNTLSLFLDTNRAFFVNDGIKRVVDAALLAHTSEFIMFLANTA